MLNIDKTHGSNHATLHRYLNGRFVSLDVDKLLSVFEPFHGGIVDRDGTVPLHFPKFSNTYDLRLGSDAVSRRVTLTLDIRLPVHPPEFWYCVHCLMADDFVALLAPVVNRIYYANPGTPDHAPKFDTESQLTLSSFMTPIRSVNELIRIFAIPDNGEQA